MHLIYKLSFVVGWYVWEETQCLGFAVNTTSGTRWGVLERVPRGEGGWPCVASLIYTVAVEVFTAAFVV